MVRTCRHDHSRRAELVYLAPTMVDQSSVSGISRAAPPEAWQGAGPRRQPACCLPTDRVTSCGDAPPYPPAKLQVIASCEWGSRLRLQAERIGKDRSELPKRYKLQDRGLTEFAP